MKLIEEKVFSLLDKTERETPKLAGRADFIYPKYIGLSKKGIFHFKTNSQSRPGYFWYQTIEIKNMRTLVLTTDEITADTIKRWFEIADVNLYCSCFTKGNKVLMKNGEWKDISEVKEGDYVINKKGRATRVKGVTSRESEQILTIKFNGNTIRCTPEHKFLVRKTETSSPEWVEAKDLTTDMYLLDVKKVKE